uniref:GCR1_C domain-containing protein n=1 Tax=Strongyloides venezuelensis TaxID=75913 RepID=A0A0K0FK39_STRVS
MNFNSEVVTEDRKIVEKSVDIICKNKVPDDTIHNCSSASNINITNLIHNDNFLDVKSHPSEYNENMLESSSDNINRTVTKNEVITEINNAQNEGNELKNNQIPSQTHKGRWECVDITENEGNDESEFPHINEKLFNGEDLCDTTKVSGKQGSVEKINDLNPKSIPIIKNNQNSTINSINDSSTNSPLPGSSNQNVKKFKNILNHLPLTISSNNVIPPVSSASTTPTHIVTNSFQIPNQQFQGNQNINNMLPTPTVGVVAKSSNSGTMEDNSNFSNLNNGDRMRLVNNSSSSLGNNVISVNKTNSANSTSSNGQNSKKTSIASVTSNENTSNVNTKTTGSNAGMNTIFGFFEKNGDNEGNIMFNNDSNDKGDDLIGSKINQAMDLVKFHLSRSIRLEYDQLNAQIVELKNKVQVLECQNNILKSFAPEDIVQNLNVLSKTNTSNTTTGTAGSTSTSSTNNVGTIVNTENGGLSRNSSTNNFMTSPNYNTKQTTEINNKELSGIYKTISDQQTNILSNCPSANPSICTPSPPNGTNNIGVLNYTTNNNGGILLNDEQRQIQSSEECITSSSNNANDVRRKISGSNEASNSSLGIRPISSLQDNNSCNVNEGILLVNQEKKVDNININQYVGENGRDISTQTEKKIEPRQKEHFLIENEQNISKEENCPIVSNNNLVENGKYINKDFPVLPNTINQNNISGNIKSETPLSYVPLEQVKNTSNEVEKDRHTNDCEGKTLSSIKNSGDYEKKISSKEPLAKSQSQSNIEKNKDKSQVQTRKLSKQLALLLNQNEITSNEQISTIEYQNQQKNFLDKTNTKTMRELRKNDPEKEYQDKVKNNIISKDNISLDYIENEQSSHQQDAVSSQGLRQYQSCSQNGKTKSINKNTTNSNASKIMMVQSPLN